MTLRPLLNVSSERDWIVLLAWLLGCFMPPGDGARAHLALFGEQGSAKSTATRLLLSLVDPYKGEARQQPGKAQDLAISAKNCAVLAYDNISYLPDWLSDALCRLATGAAFTTRELYSDDSEVLLSAKCPVVMNGISEFVSRGDLLDRLLCVTLAPIAPNKRRLESEYWRSVDQARPAIFGALLDAVVTALRRLPTMPQPADLPRLADFALWVEAAAPALGWPAGHFLSAYKGMHNDASATALEGNTLALLLIEHYSGKPFEGFTKTLLDDLSATFSRERPAPKEFPKTPKGLANQLRRIAPELRSVGLSVTFSEKNERLHGSLPGTVVRITPIAQATVADKIGSTTAATVTAFTASESQKQTPVAVVADPIPRVSGDELFPDEQALPPGWKIERCDHQGTISHYGIYRIATNGYARTEPTQYQDQAIADAWRVVRQP
jgi:hypothetical protein